ncbi:MAG: hypothetical protein KUG77_07585 [Nannocystaceae bacterium]|nr:hypothetical protein [Nannocystaceae bacterium]
MRVYDGLQRFELYRAVGGGRSAARESGDAVPAREFVQALRHGPRESVAGIVDFLVRDFAWTPADFDRHDAALLRLTELLESGRVEVVAFRPSGSAQGDVPDEGDVQELSDLAAEEEDEVAAGATIEAPMGIAPESAVEPPPGFEADFEVADPQMPAFDFEIA